MNPYAVLAGLGASLGLWLTVRNAAGQHKQAVLAAGLAGLSAALVGGRISFVLLHGAYFNTHPDEILQVWMGGLWWPGALLLAAAALWLYSRSRHLCLAELADNLLPLFHLLCFGAWLGCWLSGYAYGPASPQGAWWGIPAPDEAGVWSPRLPLQFLSMALFAGFTLIIETKQPAGGRRGAKASLNLAALGLTLLPLALFRMDYLPRLSGLRLDAWAAVLVFLSGAACWGLPLWLNARKSPSASNSQPG